MIRRRFLALVLVLAACGGGGGGGGHGGGGGAGGGVTLAFDFQNETGPVAAGHVRILPDDLYTAERGNGFLVAPRAGVDSRRKVFTLYGKTVTIDEAIPDVVLSDATRDCVTSAAAYTFRADVPKGKYDVTLWLGDVTTPLYQVRATVNDVVVDVDRMDVNHLRGNFDASIYGGAVPRTVRVAAKDGSIRVTVGPHPDGDRPITWTYEQDEDPVNPPSTKTATLVPAFTAAALQAIELHPAADPPLVMKDGEIALGSAPKDAALRDVVDLLNRGALDDARAALDALDDADLRAAKANALFWLAGDPAFTEDEPEVLAQAEALLAAVVADDPADHAAADLLREVRIAAGAERYRRLYGTAASGSSAAENMGRSCALVENLPEDHPYFRKGRILWIRNRGGLDPRRVTVGWERAQALAREADADWGARSPYVHLYATDEWQPDGRRWSVIDWAAVAGPGPDWARGLMSDLNGWLDLFEWWSIHRQTAEGDIGGGWTDDVEIVPAFGLMAFVLEGASDITSEAVLRFADGIWDSDIVDSEAGYQAQYADVEHTAEPTGNMLHLPPLVRYGDPEAIERLLRSARTFRDLFLDDGAGSALGHRHLKGNHLSATQIATNPNHRADLPLCGRVVAPFAFLVWLTENPGAVEPLEAWIRAWAEDAARTDGGKPAGVFPQAVWTPDDGIGLPGTSDWWSADATYGVFNGFPDYQFYLYSLCGFFWLRTGEDVFRAPFDALRDLTLLWAARGRGSPGAAPERGSEDLWAGGMLAASSQGAVANVKIGSGLSDWDGYLARFGTSYGRFLLDPTDDSPIADLETTAAALVEKWPYRTTEGLMTDRILVPGWADVISYYLGADVFSVFFGMPVHAVTWRDTTRLFAAAVTKATPTEVRASVYLFADADREVGVRPWQVEPGADYVLEGGPAGLGREPAEIDQTVPFRVERPGDGVSFVLPGRTEYAVRIRQTAAPASGGGGPRPDLAVAARDVALARTGEGVTVRVHNVGAAGAASVRVSLRDAAGTEVGSATIPALEAPLDLVPKSVTVAFAWTPAEVPAKVEVVIDPDGAIAERIETNNRARAVLGGAAPDWPPPMLEGLSATSVAPGGEVLASGRGFREGLVLLAAESPAPDLAATLVDGETLRIGVAAGAPAGIYLVSVRNPDGKGSNLLPLEVR